MKYVIKMFQTRNIKHRNYSSQGSFTQEGITKLILLKQRAVIDDFRSPEVIKEIAFTSRFFNNR